MKPTRNELLLIATGVIWVIAYSAWTADWLIGPSPFVFERALRRIPLCAFGALSCWVMKELLDRIAARTWRVRLASALALCVVAAFVYDAANTLVFYVVAPRWGAPTMGARLQNVMMIVWVFFAWSALYFAIDASVEAGTTRLRLADAQTAAMRARNQALAQQINPHFLFNALNTVSGLILEGEPARAERVTVALAALLRRSLETDCREFIPLGEEMDAVHRYLDIEENRFEDRLVVVEQVPAHLRSLAVPPMILQPLVENAMKHGVARTPDRVRLAVTAALQDDMLRVTVSDDAPAGGPAASANNGIGQLNVQERLALLYGARASLTCGARSGRGYACDLLLPAVQHAAA